MLLHAKWIFGSYRSPIGTLSNALESRHLGLSINVNSLYFARDLMAQTGVKCQPETLFWRKTPKLAPKLS
ncbi:uncharacterized protein DS421_6g187320 [Arachis hypogaea]|nr:uncharacterized protein DS421_6g187320 [Arachis hypogaea]